MYSQLLIHRKRSPFSRRRRLSVRVWCRDWWLYPAKVIKTITTIAEKNKKAK